MTDKFDPMLHPLYCLSYWEMLVRDALDHSEPEGAVTVSSAIDYLDRNLTYLGTFEELPFEKMAHDLNRSRRHLERVLHDGEQVETGAPCMRCSTPQDSVHLRLERGIGEDIWRCPRCKQESSEGQYRFAVMAQYLEHSDRLTAPQIEEQHGIPASTIRRWCSEVTRRVGGEWKTYPARLRSIGKDADGRNLYSVERVLELRRETRGGAA